MHKAGETPDPQAEETFQRSKLNWSLKKEAKNAELLDFYKALIQLRKTHRCLNLCDREATKVHLFKEQECILLERGLTGSADLVLCVLNFSSDQQNLPVPKGVNINQMLLHSITSTLSTWSDAPNESSQLSFLDVQPQSFIAYSATYV